MQARYYVDPDSGIASLWANPPEGFVPEVIATGCNPFFNFPRTIPRTKMENNGQSMKPAAKNLSLWVFFQFKALKIP